MAKRKSKDTGIAEVQQDDNGSTIVIDDVEKFTSHLESIANREESHLAVVLNPFQWKKIKLDGDALHVTYTERLDGGIVFETDRKCNALVHQDLRSALNSLSKHLALICDTSEAVAIRTALNEGVEITAMTQEDYYPNIKVTGVSISGESDQEGIVIIGQKRIGNKVFNMISPFMKWEESEAYEFLSELQEDLHQICEEANQYMFHSKVAAAQLELDFDNEGGEESEEN